MAEEPPVTFAVEPEGLTELVRRLRREQDGDALRKELAQSLYDEMKPAAALARSGIMSMSSSGPGGTAPGLRSSIARKIMPEVKLGGNWSGARVRAYKTHNIRRFRNAPKRTAAARGWRTQSYGGPWRTQRGKPYWFDRAMDGRMNAYRKACERAMENMAQRIAGRR